MSFSVDEICLLHFELLHIMKLNSHVSRVLVLSVMGTVNCSDVAFQTH